MSKTGQNNNNDMDVSLPVKRVTGETVEENMTVNAIENILPARYLRENEDGEVVEEPEELFERVAKNVALADVVYQADEYNETVEVYPSDIRVNASQNTREDLCEEVFGEDVSLSEEEEDEDATVELTEMNAYAFSYDTVYERVSEDLQDELESTKDSFHDMMVNLSFMPNSPTLMNAGAELQQLSACFVDSPDDDIHDIHETAKEAAEIFQSGGGNGYAFSHLRPYGDRVGSTGGIASGPISFMRTYDQVCGTIAQGGQRRGAQMGIMNVEHPDIIEFIHAKDYDVSLVHTLLLNDPDDFTHNSFASALEEARDLIIEEDGMEKVPEHLRNAAEGHLSNFNISVAVTDGFMEAVQNDEEYELINPRTDEPYIAKEETKDLYSWFDLGHEVEVGEPLTLPAREIWERITKGAWDNGEPGVIYIDRVNDLHTYDVEENPEYEIYATNPCGEQPLLEYEACNLGHINLSTVVDKDTPDWREFSSGNNLEEDVRKFLDESIDWDEFNYRIEKGTHFLENVVTMSDFPIEKITETVHNNRKIGLGIMGLAQMYVQMGVKYGSDEANEIAKQLMMHINHESKRVSNKIAVGEDEYAERGCFGNWDDSKYADPTSYADWFKKVTGEKAEDWEDGYPNRNHNTTTIAPTGTTSMLGDTTGGCEPIYQVAYYKNVSGDVQGDEMLVEFDDYFLRTLEENGIDVENVKEEAQEQMANNEFEGVDSLETVPNEIGELFVTTGDLTANEHAMVQCACQNGVDSAISKTTNAPNDATPEDAREAFELVYENGGKGVTYYRDGTRSKQVKTTRLDNQETEDPVEKVQKQIEEGEIRVEDIVPDNSVLSDVDLTEDSEDEFITRDPRGKRLFGMTEKIQTGYGDMIVTINERDGVPFEVVANIGKSGGYTQSFTEAIARLISQALRSGVDPREVAEQIENIGSPKIAWDQGEEIQSIPDGIATAMKRYLEMKDSTGDNIGLENNTIDIEKMDDESDENEVISSGESPECPECGSLDLYYSEGCKTCESCGWSEC